MKPNIMFVDDSIRVLDSIKWIFRDERYYLFAFNNPFDALSVIKTIEWGVVVADQSMKNMNGLEFLKRVRANSPHTVGIIMTGDNEFTEASDTLYLDCVYRCVKKPLNNDEIKAAVKKAIYGWTLTRKRTRRV